MPIRIAAFALLAVAHALAQAQSNAASNTFRVQCAGQTCNIKIIFDGGRPKTDIEDLQVVRGNRNAHIVWHLPTGFRFNAALGDGVFLKDANDGQFADQYATDEDTGSPSGDGRSGKNFHWRDLNTKKNTYHYKVQFRDANGNLFLFDPTIINDG